MNKDQLISWVELADAHGDRPFWIVEQVQLWGYSRAEAIEIYRIGTLGWSLTRRHQRRYNEEHEGCAEV